MVFMLRGPLAYLFFMLLFRSCSVLFLVAVWPFSSLLPLFLLVFFFFSLSLSLSGSLSLTASELT